jgi:hypothetical protein
MAPSKIRSLCGLAFACCLNATAFAQNVGIGVSNPQKGKLEIAGALGGHTTVLTIGSDGTGISLQRNWPTIGLNQYRDSVNTQRFIGTGYAASIFLSQDNGSIVFTHFGQGNANQEILTATYPLVIDPIGTTVVNGGLLAKQSVTLDKDLVFPNAPKVVSNALGLEYNLLPFAVGSIAASGTKTRGTSNYTSQFTAGIGYVLNFTSTIGSELILTITPRSQTTCFATYSYQGSGLYFVYIWDMNGQKIMKDFTFTAFK